MLFECVKSLSSCLWRFPFDFRDRRDDENILVLPMSWHTSTRHRSTTDLLHFTDESSMFFSFAASCFQSINRAQREREQNAIKNNPNCHRLCMRRFSSTIFMNLSNVTFNLLHLLIIIAILSSRHREDENDVYSLFPLLFLDCPRIVCSIYTRARERERQSGYQ